MKHGTDMPAAAQHGTFLHTPLCSWCVSNVARALLSAVRPRPDLCHRTHHSSISPVTLITAVGADEPASVSFDDRNDDGAAPVVIYKVAFKHRFKRNYRYPYGYTTFDAISSPCWGISSKVSYTKAFFNRRNLPHGLAANHVFSKVAWLPGNVRHADAKVVHGIL